MTCKFKKTCCGSLPDGNGWGHSGECQKCPCCEPEILETPTVKEPTNPCCEKCHIYLDYKDAHQCSDNLCTCHTPSSNSEKEEWQVDFLNDYKNVIPPDVLGTLIQRVDKMLLDQLEYKVEIKNPSLISRNECCDGCKPYDGDRKECKWIDCPCHQEEVKEDTKKEDVKECRHVLEIVSLLKPSRCKYCMKKTSEILLEYIEKAEPLKEPVKKPSERIEEIYEDIQFEHDGKWSTCVGRIEAIKLYLDETK